MPLKPSAKSKKIASPPGESGASPITAELAERLLRANMANIVRKVSAGKTLTAAERKLLTDTQDDAPAKKTYAKNYAELAEILGITRRHLQNWRVLPGAPEPAANGSHDIARWQEFQIRIGGKGAPEPAEESVDGLESEPLLKRRKLTLFCQEKEMQLAHARGQLIDSGLVRETWARKCAEANSLLRKRLENELPSELEGLEAAEIYTILTAVVDEFNEAMRGGGAFKPPKLPDNFDEIEEDDSDD
jgi:phage terminase Nu1 subunit (DNA packaging protein)